MVGFQIINAAELWQKETSSASIPTFSQALDKMLGNDGVKLGSITELLGLPGSGKTQLCLQLCAATQIPKTIGGLDAEAMYVDTNTNFTLSRFKEILNASLSRCRDILEDTSQNITEEEALKKIHYVNAFGLEKFCALMHQLPRILKERPNVRLIVIDSIAFPFKEGISVKQRTGLLFRQMAELQRVAIQQGIAIVLSNEMSTRVGLSSGSIVGSLGDAWAHRCNKRVLLSTCEENGHRVACLLKSNDSPTGVAKFQITSEGVRDVE